MLIQHEATGQVFEIGDGNRVPGGYRRVEEAARVETRKAKRCECCETRFATTHSADGVRLCWKCYDAIPADGSND